MNKVISGGKKYKKWEVEHYLKKDSKKLSDEDIIDTLLTNRGIKSAAEVKEFFNPKVPDDIEITSLGVDNKQIDKVIKRLVKAKKAKEKIIIYGDYDADGICATAIIWETLYTLGFDVLPFIPDRFSDGYGINYESVKNLFENNNKLSLIITVDNGIVAEKDVDKINKLGIDVIITDHHQKGKKIPKAFGIAHTTEVCGAALSWFLAKEIEKKLSSKITVSENNLELAAIGTVADQVPLLGANRAIVKFGLERLNNTKRIGLLSLYKAIGIETGNIGIYEVGFLIAPRLNAMGRLGNALDSLRLLCTKNVSKAGNLSSVLDNTNLERQKLVDDLLHSVVDAADKKSQKSMIIITGEEYHEGVIGLMASKLVETFYRPAIVISKGKSVSKASARSIPGVNIIELIRSQSELLIDGGGHPMAAGFSINTDDLDTFTKNLEEEAKKTIDTTFFDKKLKVDLNINFNLINKKFYEKLQKFEPTGIGNPRSLFLSEQVNLLDFRFVGRDASHAKLVFKQQEIVFEAIAFNFGYNDLFYKNKVYNICYSVDMNNWSGLNKIEFKIRDISLIE